MRDYKKYHLNKVDWQSKKTVEQKLDALREVLLEVIDNLENRA